METVRSAKTISQVFEEFLTDQKNRISHKTLLKYQSIVELYESYLERYWPAHNDDYDKITKAGGTFCGSYGPEHITPGYSEFLGYFMPRKVMCGKETMQAAGTVTKRLAKWLIEKGYVLDDEAAEDALEQAGAAVKDLPNATEVLRLLDSYCEEHDRGQYKSRIEDHFWIEKIEPGKLWLNPLTSGNSVIGPIPVPKKVTALCETGWDIGGVVAKIGKGWRLVEVWNVSP